MQGSGEGEVAKGRKFGNRLYWRFEPRRIALIEGKLSPELAIVPRRSPEPDLLNSRRGVP
jgi:hypothetical protein